MFDVEYGLIELCGVWIVVVGGGRIVVVYCVGVEIVVCIDLVIDLDVCVVYCFV